LRIQTSWDTTLCHCVKVSWHIEGTLCLPLQRSSCPRWITKWRTEVMFQPRFETVRLSGRPWGPPSHQYNGHRVFPGGQSSRGVALTTHPNLAPTLKEE
jgi:hypothetical protein